MKKTYSITGLDCPNCAANAERNIRAIDGIVDASLSFITEKLVIEVADDANLKDLLKKMTKAARRVEPEVEIREA